MKAKPATPEQIETLATLYGFNHLPPIGTGGHTIWFHQWSHIGVAPDATPEQWVMRVKLLIKNTEIIKANRERERI